MPWLRGAEATAAASLAARPKGRSEVGPGWGNGLEQHRPSAFPTYAGAGVNCTRCSFFLRPSFIFPLNKGEPGRGLKSSAAVRVFSFTRFTLVLCENKAPARRRRREILSSFPFQAGRGGGTILSSWK